MSGNDVRTVCSTPDGGLWVATAEGLNHYRNGEWTRQSEGKARSVASDQQGRLWFGDQGGGQNKLLRDRYNRAKNVIFLGLEWQDPNTLRFSRDGKLWIVCERGLTWLKPELLVATPDGNWVPDPANGEPAFGRYRIEKELPKLVPVGLVEDRDGSMWLGSLGNGLVHLDNGRVEVFTSKDGLHGDYCIPAFLDPSGALWIVGEGGLTRRSGGRFQSLTEKDGLPNDVLLDLIEDDLGNFWISGKRGIHRVVRRELEEFFAGRLDRVHSLSLGPRHGLLTPECSSLHSPTIAKTPDGHIWAATRNGLAAFDPRRVSLDTQPLSSTIERLIVNGQEIPGPTRQFPDRIELEPGAGERIEIHFGAVSLTAADRLQFRYRLEGHDSEWSEPTDLRLAFYTNLRPGAYEFRVLAANAHGVWNERDTALAFIILPYFWQTNLFYAGTAAVLIAFVAIFHLRRMAAQRRLHEIQHRQALMDEKARIAADMHDELGAALTQIAILGEVAKNQAGDVAKTRSTLNRISDAARKVTNAMSDLVWATNPRNDTLENLVAHLRQHAAEQLQDTPLEAQLRFPTDVPNCHVSATFRRNLLLVLKEALNNAVKHANATELRLNLEVTDDALIMTLQDNGRAFHPAEQCGTGYGLGNMRKRVHDLGGVFVIQSVVGSGTSIRMRVPLGIQAAEPASFNQRD